MSDGILSVVVPVFNSAKTIHQTLKSIIEQTRFDLIDQILVINDGSTDQSTIVIKKFMQEYDNNKIKLINVENGGVARARNIGLRNANAKYIAFLDSDDIWYPKKIERQLKIMEANSNIKFLGSDYADFQFKKGRHYLPFSRYKSLYNLSLFEISCKAYPVPSSVIITKKLQQQIGFFNEDMKYSEDINYFQRACALYNNYYILPETLVYMGIQKDERFNQGLSSNLGEMQRGAIQNLKQLYQGKYISPWLYFILLVFNNFKYVVRILKVRKGKG